jgi:organic hydroperoxide reductase OsmC/OhrA
MENQHSYIVKASSTTPRSGIVGADDIHPPIAFSAPPEFQGVPGTWTPEHFFVAAVATCFVSTFSGMSVVSKFDFLSLTLSAEAILQKDEGGWRFTRVIVRPRLRIHFEKDRERALRLLEKAEKYCLVARSLSCPTVLEPEIIVESGSSELQTVAGSVSLKS